MSTESRECDINELIQDHGSRSPVIPILSQLEASLLMYVYELAHINIMCILLGLNLLNP